MFANVKQNAYVFVYFHKIPIMLYGFEPYFLFRKEKCTPTFKANGVHHKIFK